MSNSSHIAFGTFDQDFCSFLEHHLTKTFEKSTDNYLGKLWCDGVLMPFVESQLTKKNVIKTRTVETRAWIGPDGQGDYEMIIRFGDIATSRYLEGLRLEDALPADNSVDWVTVDQKNRTIELRLR